MPHGAFGSPEYKAATGASDDAVQRIEAFRSLLLDWNERMNLVGPTVADQFWLRHAYDSAQLLSYATAGRQIWADLGAGAGFPGIVLAIMLREHAGAHVHLIESMHKRCDFLASAARKLDVPASVHHARAESLELRVDFVTARACAPVVRLVGYALPYISRGAIGLFLKGKEIERELAAARAEWRLQADLLPSQSDPSGRILRVTRLARA